jgi:hypothetical protein
VTRFFIPLIDVLTLLFCTFLLLPLVAGTGASTETPAALERRIRELEEELARRRKEGSLPAPSLQEELDRLRKEKQERVKVLQDRLVVRVLEVRGDKEGRLYYRDPEHTEGVLVRDEADAHELIEEDRRRVGEGRELYYLILYPRDAMSRYPLRGQREEYDRWFRDVAHGWDIPGAGPVRGGMP